MKKLPKPVMWVSMGLLQVLLLIWSLLLIFVLQIEKRDLFRLSLELGLAQCRGGCIYSCYWCDSCNPPRRAGEALTADKALEYRILYRLCESEKLEKRQEQLIKETKTWFQEIRIRQWMIWKSQFSDWEEYAELNCTYKSRCFYRRF